MSLPAHDVLCSTSVISIGAAPVFCNYADKIVNSGNRKGYELVLVACVIITTLVFCCHVLPELGLLHKSHNFTYFMILRIIYSISLSPAYPILDGIALNYLLDNGLDKAAFGNQRLYGAYGWAMISFIMGICIDYFQTKIMYLFITTLMFALVYCLIIFSKSRECPLRVVDESGVQMSTGFMTLASSEGDDAFEAERDDPSPKDREGGRAHSDERLLGSSEESSSGGCVDKVKSNPNWIVPALMFFSPVAVMFVVLHTVLSGVTSIVESLVFLFFKDSLGASNLIMGFSVVVTVLFEIPMFAYSKSLLEVVGQNNLLIIACLSYCIRVVGYTIAPNGIWVLLVEPLHGVSYAGSKMATVDFVSDVTPAHMQATAQGVLTSLSAIGKLIGVSVGGYVEENFGSNIMYRGSALLMFVFLIAFVVLVNFCPVQSSPIKYRDRRMETSDRPCATNSYDHAGND